MLPNPIRTIIQKIAITANSTNNDWPATKVHEEKGNKRQHSSSDDQQYGTQRGRHVDETDAKLQAPQEDQSDPTK